MAMSRRKRAKVIRGGQYAVLVLVFALLAFLADWKPSRRVLNVEAAGSSRDLSTALVNTIVYGAFIPSRIVIGIVLALMKLSSVGLSLADVVHRVPGIPALLCSSPSATGLPLALTCSHRRDRVTVIGLYIAETLRWYQAGLKGEMSRAVAGMSQARTTVTVVIPQAFRIILPPLTNELILLTKDSSLIYLLGLAREEYELAKFGREGLNATGSLTPILLAGVCYLIITVPLGYLSRYLERRSGRKEERGLKVTA